MLLWSPLSSEEYFVWIEGFEDVVVFSKLLFSGSFVVLNFCNSKI
ncbi:MAG: hypothetical protein CM15mP109_02370 [Candidatus Dadabacteria bacterium]|nr:MAG: hypothetical protein CM15mP109_02370 [Candidatus Dadabacteria bacterium]